MRKRVLVQASTSLAAMIALFAVFASSALATGGVLTEPATNVTSTKADLNAYVEGMHPYGPYDWPNEEGTGGRVWYAFQYGPTTAYGSGTETRLITPTSKTKVSEHLTGLTPATTYHFQIVALLEKGHYGPGGGFYGKDLTFTTAPLPGFRAATNSSKKWKVTGGLSGGSEFEFAADGEVFSLDNRCKSAKFTEVAGRTWNSLPLEAELTNCSAHERYTNEEWYGTSVDMNSCKFVSSADSGPPYKGTLTIKCDEAGDHIVLQQQLLTCRIEIGPQEFPDAVTFENSGTGTGARVLANVEAIDVEYTTSDDYKGVACAYYGLVPADNGVLNWNATLGAVNVENPAEQWGLKVEGLSE